MRNALTFTAMLCLAHSSAIGQNAADKMPPISNYLLDESLETALAMSAAPENIGAAATVLILRSDGHHRVRAGSNGFTCLVQRSWSSPLVPEQPGTGFWDPQLRAPICYNAEGARTILGEYLRRTELAMAGKTRAEMKRAIDTDLAEGRLRAPRGLAFAYMVSAGQYLGQAGRFRPHIMLYIPYADREQLGSNTPSSAFPVMFEHEGGPFATIVVPLPEFVEVPETEASG